MSMLGTVAVQGVANADLPCGLTNRVVPNGTPLFNAYSTPVGFLAGGTLIADGQRNGNMVLDNNTGGWVALDGLARATDATCY